MDVTYGIKVADKEDKYVTIAEAAIESASRAGVPGAYLVDFFPVRECISIPKGFG